MSSAPQSDEVLKSSMLSSTDKNLSVLSDGELYPVSDCYPYYTGKTGWTEEAEIKALTDVYRYVQESNGGEEDILLIGDSNRNPPESKTYKNIWESLGTGVCHLPVATRRNVSAGSGHFQQRLDAPLSVGAVDCMT